MADIASGDVTYTLQSRKIGESGERLNVFKVAFGDSALTYPSGGVPLLKASLGVPNYISALKIFDQDDSNGFVYKYDFVNAKIRIYQGAGFTPAGTNQALTFTGSALATHVHDLKVIGGQASTTDNEVAHYATDILGKEAATDATIAGSASATKGGVVAVGAGTPAGTINTPTFTGTAVAAGALVELGSVAIAAVALYVEVSGY